MRSSKQRIENDYNDGYSTCDSTHVTLCMYPMNLDPREISEKLGIEPTAINIRGETKNGGRPAPINAWFLSSKEIVKSKDSRRHLDWVLDQIAGKEKVIGAILKKETRVHLLCFWRTKQGHGGPTLSPEQMKRIGKFGIELWYDFYA